MKPNKILLTAISLLFTLSASAVKGDEPTWNEAVPISHMKNTLKDPNDYFYEILNEKELAVVKGGAYMGDVIIPENITCEGKTYKVTTVRREAFYKTADAHNIGNITSITLPPSVTLIGADAFRNNRSLHTVNYNPKARIEVRAFWGCPNLKIKKNEPKYAFTGFFDSEGDSKEKRTEAMSTFYLPYENPDDVVASYQWAIHKYNHNGIFFREWANMSNENAMACFSAETSKVRGGIYNLLDDNNVETMFKGNMWSCAQVVLADNSYVGTHEFLAFSRWMFGEKETPAPADFKQAMAAKYGKKVKYSYEVGKLANSNEKLIITEFAVKNKKAHVVFSWLKNGKEVCSYTITQEVDGDTSQSVWNVDDDGNYGIPELLSVVRDEHGNIELFLHHPAPESRSFYHLVQKGNKFECVGEDSWYVWY
ncbi:MAG: leucine-rich repeat domain-containing protein [Bacteroidaceae bacterium]|nr:leucine-rich repeat domain-containing protein [Bacteroidaceae bacterium]